MAGKIRQIHDKLMKSILSDEQARLDFFNAFLPEALKKVLDLKKIEHVSGSFLSAKLTETHADMVFRCPLLPEAGSGEILLCIIVTEHKSHPDDYSVIQLGGYCFDVYRTQLLEGRNPLQIVLPFLYYHGKEKWSPPTMIDLFPHSPDALKKFIPSFDFIFRNIQQYTDDQIRQLGVGLFTSAILAQKYGRDPEKLRKRFDQIYGIIDSWEGRNLFESLTVYILDILEIDIQELHIITKKIPMKMKTKILSLGDRLRESGKEEGIQIGVKKGREEGREEGRTIGKEEGIEKKNFTATKNMLEKDFPVSTICDILDVTPEFVQKVKETLRKEE